VLELLGKGGQGEVYSVLDHTMGEESALKILTGAAIGDVWREAKLLTQLSGKFLLRVRNAGLASGVPFVVSEIARHGTTSDEMISGIGVPIDRAMQWVIHAGHGASRMHDLGLVHNDLKPENLFLNSTGDALLGDLGFASELNSAGFAALTGGTPATMSPEIAEAVLLVLAGTDPGQPCSVASDVYALGATLYWLLAGRPPYAGASHADVVAQVVGGPPPPLGSIAPHVPLNVVNVVETSMARLPSDRFESASSFTFALTKLTLPKRKWSRQPPHLGHEFCFLGTKGKSAMAVCASQPGISSQLAIAITHQPSGRNAEPPRTATRAQLPQRLRAVFRNYK